MLSLGLGLTSQQGGGFVPTDVSGCMLWLRPDAANVTLVSGNVSAFTDASGAGNSLTQGTSAKRPGYSATGAPNGLPCLTFNGTNQILVGTAAPFAPQTGCTVFIVHKFTATSPLQVSYQCGSAANGLGFAIDGNAVNEREIALQGVGYVHDANSSATTSWESWTATSATGSQNLRVNGVQKATGALTPASPSAAQALGGAADGNQLQAGSVAEVIAYNTVLSAGKIALVEAYLQGRYGLL